MPALLLWWLLCWILAAGVSLPSCNTTMSVRDLGCHLGWKCSDIDSSTTFTVQTKAQGEDWKNVSDCFQISSSVCDLSEVFSSFRVYNSVQLVLNPEHGDPQKMPSTLCDPIKEQNAMFSPPSISTSLEGRAIWVEVSFPCAPLVACYEELEESECCPVSRFLKLNTTVVLYNTEDVTDTQTFSVLVLDEAVLKRQFGGLLPGQEYCAVAHYRSSPLSEPQCVYVPAQGHPKLFLVGVCGVLLAALLAVGCVLWRLWVLSDTTLPKPLRSLVDQDVSMLEDPAMQTVAEDEGSIVHLSLVSLSSMVVPDSYWDAPHTRRDRGPYYTAAFLQDSEQEEAPEETRSYSGALETDGDTAPVSRWSSLPVLRTGMVCLLGVLVPAVGSGIPLNSVRVAGGQMDQGELEILSKGLKNPNSDVALYPNIC